MIRRLAFVCAAALALAACGDTRNLSLNYTKDGMNDIDAAKDKKAFLAVPGVSNVISDVRSDGTVKVQIFVEEGKELGVFGKTEELGYTRMR